MKKEVRKKTARVMSDENFDDVICFRTSKTINVKKLRILLSRLGKKMSKNENTRLTV